MYAPQTSYISPKLEARPRPETGSAGVFARQPIAAGELLIIWGGEVVSGEQLRQLPARAQMHGLQIEADFYLVPTRPPEPADYVNHSCHPNAGLNGQISLVALREIAPGEEICFDYAMSDSSPYDEFECRCGAANCRRRVKGSDWTRPELWDKYGPHFSPYLLRRIERLKNTAA